MKIKQLQDFINSKNIAESLDKDVLSKIGAKVVREYKIDIESRTDIDKINREAMKLAKQTYEKKTFPWPGAANIKYPLITVAAIQFASRSLPELVPDDKIVNFKITGDDADKSKEERSERVSAYMDFQLTEEIDGWLDSTDRLLHNLPIIGTSFKKVYYDGLHKKVASLFLTYDDFVVNIKAKNLKSARRKSHKIYKYENDVVERVNAGLWSDINLGVATGRDDNNDDGTDSNLEGDDAPHLFIEQHRWIDLDNDGYEEPYIVTVHKNTRTVVRIIAGYDVDGVIMEDGKPVRIEQLQFFVKYPFIPNPDGGFYDIGFGTLLYPINRSINTVINQLLDGGTLANTGGGFLARGIQIGSGNVKFKPGEWKVTNTMGQDLKSGILPLPIKEPSQVLFSLLGLLISAGKDISSVQDAMSGQKPGENVSAATVTALIEQGLKVFSGIYKRIYRSMGEELDIIYMLNSKYLDDKKYFNVVDREINKDDFETKSFDLRPSADPQFSLDVQRVGKAESLLKISGRPGLDEDGITANYLKAIKAPDTLLIPKEERPEDPPNPDIIKLGMEQARLDIEERKSGLERMELFAKIEKLRAEAINYIAKAESEEAGQNLDEYKAFIDELGVQLDSERKKEETPKAEPKQEPQA